LSDKIVEMHICQNPKISEEELFSYVATITPQIHQLIRTHSVTIAENLCSDFFNEKDSTQAKERHQGDLAGIGIKKEAVCQ
jgi:hypothetical protein